MEVSPYRSARSKTGQAEWHGSPRRFMQSHGKQDWKVTRSGYNTETIDRSRGLDNNYRCIARGILKNKGQIEIPDKAENRTGLRTEQEQMERRPRSKSRHRLAEKKDLEQ